MREDLLCCWPPWAAPGVPWAGVCTLGEKGCCCCWCRYCWSWGPLIGGLTGEFSENTTTRGSCELYCSVRPNILCSLMLWAFRLEIPLREFNSLIMESCSSVRRGWVTSCSRDVYGFIPCDRWRWEQGEESRFYLSIHTHQLLGSES